MAKILSHPNTFKLLLSYVDFLTLFRLMQTRRDFRWDIRQDGSNGYRPKQIWVHKLIRQRIKGIFYMHGGLRSTKERRNFWIYRTKLTSLVKQKEVGQVTTLYLDLISQMSNESNRTVTALIDKDVGRTFPDLQYFKRNEDGNQQLRRILFALSIYKHVPQQQKN